MCEGGRRARSGVTEDLVVSVYGWGILLVQRMCAAAKYNRTIYGLRICMRVLDRGNECMSS